MEGAVFLTGFLGGRTVGWAQLLQSERVLIVSEAGMGKSFECRQAQKDIWEAGESAFFIELSDLANGPLETRLGAKELPRFKSWEAAQSERAVFFLDSVDELTLTATSFEAALKSIARTLGANLGRACIVLTTRPIAVDRELIEEHLPVHDSLVVHAAELFANTAMRVEKRSDASGPPAWRFVALAPLSEAQMCGLAAQRGVEDVDGLMKAVELRNAWEYARRPLDFFELCNDWNEHRRIQAHRIQLDESIEIKLRGRHGRKERPLTTARAREGASQIALAMLLARKITVWHGTDDDSSGRGAALDPSVVLSGWDLDEVRTLLERPLFGFANYGRVRFHHRSAMEFLAAERLESLRKSGLPDRMLRELLSALGPDGKVLIRPSMQAVAAWLARDVSMVRRLLLEHQPSVLLRFGDPESLDSTTRQAALRRYVEMYGKGGWRGENVPSLQVKRFASKDLGDEIASLWSSGITNPEVRETLLELIGEAKIETCTGIAHNVATDASGDANDRFNGLEALAKLEDARLVTLLNEFASLSSDWPLAIVPRAILALFPANMSTAQLIGCLGRMRDQKRRYGGISSHLPIILSKVALAPEALSDLRVGLHELVASDLSWNEELHRLATERRDLVPALLAACVREVQGRNFDHGVAKASALACILGDRDHHAGEDMRELIEALGDAPERLREEIFWEICRVVFEVCPEKERSASSRSFFVQNQSEFQPARSDSRWLMRAIADPARSFDDRELALEIAIGVARTEGDSFDSVERLEAASEGTPSLMDRVALYRKQVENPPPEPEWVKEAAERRESSRREHEENMESWRQFHQELMQDSDAKFAATRVGNTLLNLWRAMESIHSDFTKPGWNRGFLERVFDEPMADRFREAFAQAWRRETPSVRSERSEEDKNTYMRSWRIGLAGIYAEAEDMQWASKLSEAEARLACRYALVDLNRLPPWVDSLIKEHPDAVDDVIGSELAHDLREKGNSHVMLLQYLRNAEPQTASHFVPRVRTWVDEVLGTGANPPAEKLKRALSHLVEHGTSDDHAFVQRVACEALDAGPTQDQLLIWLPVLGALDLDELARQLEILAAATVPAKDSTMVHVMGELFGHHASFSLERITERPELLLGLVRMANQHVRPQDDEQHEGVFSPDGRDNAEYARSGLFGMLMDCKGPEAWRIKLSLADDPEAIRYRDRVKAIAEEKLAAELDGFKLSERDIVRFERDFKFSPKSRREMATMLKCRLDEIDDLLRQDSSPRAMWAKNDQELILRPEIARVLKQLAGESYIAVEEAVTAEEKEIDIRLISKAASLEAVIELKIGERWSIAQLTLALREQVVGRYMAPENRRVGALVISWAGRKTWQEPGTRRKVKFDDLIKRLDAYAQELVQGLGDDAFLTVRGLNLAPRNL